MNAVDIKKILEPFIGQPSTGYCKFSGEISYRIKEVFPDDLKDRIRVTVERQNVTLKFINTSPAQTTRYSGIFIATIKGKVKKGESHYKYGTSWTDYTYKDFDVSVHTDSGEVEDIIPRLYAADDSLNATYNKYINYMDQIKNLTGVSSDSDVKVICDFISKNYYKLCSIKNKV